MSTRLPLGWARILDCLPSSELSAVSGLAPSEQVPLLDTGSHQLLPQQTSNEAFSRDKASASDGDSAFRLDDAIPPFPPARNLGSVAKPFHTTSVS